MRREKGSAGEEWCIRCANNASSDRSTKGRGVGRRRGVAKSALSGKPQQWRSFRIKQPQQ